MHHKFTIDCWQEISTNTIEILDNLQLMFLRCLMTVGSGCPKPALFSETGTIIMEWRILEEKLLFLHHVASLPDSALAKEVYVVQKQLALPGLVQECQEFLVRYGVADISTYTKSQWKQFVKPKIRELNKSKILHQVKTKDYKKLNYQLMERDDFRANPYLSKLNVTDARLRFKINCEMTPTIQMNFQSDSQHTKELWTCPECAEPGDAIGCRDTQRHVLICPGYEAFRENMDLTNDKDIVTYFQQVIQHRLNNL